MDIESELLKVKEFYNLEENECYHTLNHIRIMLNDFVRYEKAIDKYYPSINKKLLIDIILWHDAGYVPGDKGNEYEAAALYMKNNKNYNMTVVDAIVSTIPFSKNYDSDYNKLIHDLDWLAFSCYNTMVENDILLKNEFPSVDDDVFIQNKINFLNHILGVYGNKLYVSEVFKHLNEIAFDNIQRRIEELRK